MKNIVFVSHHPKILVDPFLSPSIPAVASGFLEGLLTPFTAASRSAREGRRLTEIARQKTLDPDAIDERVTAIPEHVGQLCDVPNNVCFARDSGCTLSVLGLMSTAMIACYNKNETELALLVGALIVPNAIDYTVQQYRTYLQREPSS